MDTESIEIVIQFPFLETHSTQTGNFTLTLDHLKEKALHSFSNIQKHALLSRLNPNNASQITH